MDTKILIQTHNSSLKIIKHNFKELLEKCILEISGKLIEKPKIIVYGKVCHQNRNIGFFSNFSIGYKYSNKLQKSNKLTPALNELLEQINKKFNSDFNGILINKYDNGTQYIGSHSDDENGLGNIGILSLSYGAERNFRIRNKKDRKIVENIKTKDDEIILMEGDFQKEFMHEIPIQKKVTNIRYSFTFRKHII